MGYFPGKDAMYYQTIIRDVENDQVEVFVWVGYHPFSVSQELWEVNRGVSKNHRGAAALARVWIWLDKGGTGKRYANA